MQSTGSEIALLAGGNDSLSAGIGFMRESNTTWGTAIKFYNHEAATSGATDDLQEVMRINSSGHLLIGKTADDNTTVGTVIHDNGFMSIARSANVAMILDRSSSDGDIYDLQKLAQMWGILALVAAPLELALATRAFISVLL